MKMDVSSKCTSQLDVAWFPLERNWKFCLVGQALLSPEMFLHERLHGGITIFFFSFPFSYQVSFIVFKHLRLQHQKSDMCILLALSPSWYLTKICATHVFVVLGDDIEQGNLIIFVFVSPTTYVITHRTNENTNCLYPPFICHMAVTLIFVSTP